nr:hypothetical protein CTI12_AA105810 [Tanacetum cinerariifolium]
KWVVYASGFQEVEVRRHDEAFGVNIHLKKCACNMWELTCLPCVHAVAGYIHLKKDPELGVTEWFLKNKWFESYQYSIRPVPGSKLWKKSYLPKPLPPGKRKLPGHNKSKCTHASKPKPDNFYEIPTDEERKHGSNNVRERDQYQQAGPSVDEIPNNLWKKSYLPKPLPPGERKLPGRPRKRRIRHPSEYDHEISRVGRVMHCHRERDQYQQAGPSVDEIPKYREDPVIPESSSGNKRKEPPVKKKSSQVNEASGSKSNLTPEVESSSASWLEGCRKVIGIDGCFLTHTCKGQLLTAVGRDANNQMFLIAWSVVGVENKNNWCWFLSLLSDDLNLNDGAGLTVISDGHKGLLEAVKIWLPDAEHRQLFWKAAASSMNEQFLKVMKEIKALDENAYTWLVDHDPNTWCRAYFEVDRSCVAFENGISESFNSKILSARGKPIITMLEDIRVYIMQRVWFLNKNAMELNDSITPFARRHLEFMKIRQ